GPTRHLDSFPTRRSSDLRRRKARLRIARRKHNAAGETAVEKPLPQPRQRRVCGYISNVSTIDLKLTFFNDLTRLLIPTDFKSCRSEEHTSELQSPCNLVC